MRAIIADGSTLVSERLRLLLEKEGIEVVGEATDAARAMYLANTTRPDAVLLDFRLPAGSPDGSVPGLFDTVRQIKRTSPASKIVVLTPGFPAPYCQQCEGAGADFVFDKAFEFDKVTQVMKDGEAGFGKIRNQMEL